MLHDPGRLECQAEAHGILLLHQHLVPIELEVVAFLLYKASDFPLLAGIVHDRDVLSDHAPCWNSELQLGQK